MRIENGKIVLGRKNCFCGDGTVRPRIACPKCNGTGKGVKGGANGCKRCHGMRTTYDLEASIPCPQCKGNPVDADNETLCDYLPADVFPALTFRVYRTGGMTIAESLLGFGCVYSCQDYGSAWNRKDDEALIADVRAHTGIQATKIADNDGNVCDHIGVFVSPNGYTVKPVFRASM